MLFTENAANSSLDWSNRGDTELSPTAPVTLIDSRWSRHNLTLNRGINHAWQPFWRERPSRDSLLAPRTKRDCVSSCLTTGLAEARVTEKSPASPAAGGRP